MKTILLALATLALVACAELDTAAPTSPESAAETLTMGQTQIVETEDGATFEITVVHDGSLSPVEELALIQSVGVVGVTPVGSTLTPVEEGFVPPVNPALVADDSRPVNVFVTGVDADTVLGNYRWDWIDDIDEEQIEAFVEDLCPPWH